MVAILVGNWMSHGGERERRLLIVGREEGRVVVGRE
jgi:hypothetical protein